MKKVTKRVLGLVDEETKELTPIPKGKKVAYETVVETVEDTPFRMNYLFFKTFGYYYHFFYGDIAKQNLEPQMIVRLMRLACCLRLNSTGKLMYTERTPLKYTNEVLSKILNLKERELRETKKYLIENHLIAINENKEIIISENFIVKGTIRTDKNTQERDVTRVFENGFQKIYSQCDPKAHKKLYYLIRLLPYVHVESNSLCENPLELDPTKIKNISWSGACDLIGLDKKQKGRLRSYLWDLKIDGEPLIAEFVNSKGKAVIVNPLMIYKGRDKEKCYSLRMLFQSSYSQDLNGQ